VAASAAVVRGERAHGAPPVHRLDRGRVVAEAASGGAGSDRLERRDRLVDGDPGRGGRAGQQWGITDRPDPVDRGKTGSKLHVLSDANGLPLLVGVSAANTHDSHALQPMVMGLPAIRSRRGPRRRKPARLRADKAYDSAAHRTWLRERGIIPRIARRGIDTSDRLGRYRWKIERTIAWLTGYRRLTIRYERHAHLFAAFLSLAAAITCFKKLAT